MKRFLLCIVTLMALCSLFCLTASAAETVEVQVTGILDYPKAEAVFEQLNSYRVSNGLSKLVLDANLTAAAMKRAVECSVVYGGSHSRPDGTKCNTAYPYSGSWAENTAAGQASASAVMSAWQNSSGHDANMRNSSMTHVGIGCAYVDGTYYWCQVFMNKGADNTNDYSGYGLRRFLYTIDVLKSGLSTRQDPVYAKTVIDPQTGDITGNAFSLQYLSTHADGTTYTTLIPIALQRAEDGTVPDVLIKDDEGNDFAELSLAGDGSSSVVIIPIAENGTVTVDLPCYEGEADPITVQITIHTHNLTATVYEPTCRKRGYTFYQCAGCTQYTADYVDKVDCVAAEERARVREGTCRTQGYTGDVVCKWCGTTLEDGEWYYGDCRSSDWVVQYAATETEEGLRYKYCLDCRAILESETIPVLSADTIAGSFVDVNATQYFYDPVLWASENDITQGTSATTFSPDAPCTRAQVVTFLWRTAGCPAPTTEDNPFADVPAGQWYSEAVLWAVEEGITIGTSDTTFSPDQPCTRAHVVTFLWRWFGEPQPFFGFNFFFDVEYGAYYYDAVLWAVEEGITNGTSDFYFSPDQTCTRGQIVTFLYRAMT